METIDSRIWIVVALVALALLAVIAAVVYQKRQSRRLHQRFGPEYDRTVEKLGSTAKAEDELKAREKRVRSLRIVPLSAADAMRFGEQWREIQGRFIDDPRRAAGLADRLVRELMVKRGYPVGDFERSAADISVDHPVVVQNYRAALAIVSRNDKDTEMLRRALVHYRALFDELLEVDAAHATGARPAEVRI